MHHLSWHRSGYPKEGTLVTEGEATEGTSSIPTVAGAKSSQAARLRISSGTSATCGESGLFWLQLCAVYYTTDEISQEQRSLQYRFPLRCAVVVPLYGRVEC